MPTSAVSICNNALLRIGAERIASLTDDSDAARACTEFYAQSRDALLRAHPWNFTIKRAALARHDATPASDYDYQYVLPADCLYVEDVNVVGWEDWNDAGTGVQPSWRIEDSDTGNRVLRTNERSVVLRYVSTPEPGRWDALFIEAFIEDLTAKLAVPLTGKESLLRLHAQLAEAVLQRAISRNAHETGTEYAQANTSLTRVRGSRRAPIPGVTTRA